MRWIVLAIFLLAMAAVLKWHEARTPEMRITFAIVAIVAFALIAVLGTTMV